MTRAPVVAAWGAGVDSTAMIVELADPIDMVLFADPGSEKAGTYAFIPIFRRWMDDHGISSEIVCYRPRNFKHWPPYATIAENMLTNATLPSVVFNRGSCSQKWKASAQDTWTAEWEPARRCWDAGGRVVKLIGYDASARDTQRYHHAIGCEDPRHEYRYPLREWGWVRERCEQRIIAAGLPLPPKSSCFFGGSIKPDEVMELSADELRIIVLMEARAKPRLRNVDGSGAALFSGNAAQLRVPAASPSSYGNAASCHRPRLTGSSQRHPPSCLRSKRRRPPSRSIDEPRWGAGSMTSTAAPKHCARRRPMPNPILKRFTVQGTGEFPIGANFVTGRCEVVCDSWGRWTAKPIFTLTSPGRKCWHVCPIVWISTKARASMMRCDDGGRCEMARHCSVLRSPTDRAERACGQQQLGQAHAASRSYLTWVC